MDAAALKEASFDRRLDWRHGAERLFRASATRRTPRSGSRTRSRVSGGRLVSDPVTFHATRAALLGEVPALVAAAVFPQMSPALIERAVAAH